MSIWFRPYTIAEVTQLRHGTLMEHLGIELTEIGDDYVRATMPVDARTRQPMGLLHGGASVALAETLGSIGAGMVVDLSKQSCVGIEINANHLRSVHSGHVTGTVRPVHIGRTLHVWQTEIADASVRPLCIARLTMFVLDQPHPGFTNQTPR
jgi:1,4-dihydroxy-2-naphthoyl-CoA hydrolase